MNNFNFYNPTKIIFGKDRLSELDALIHNDAKVLILYGKGSVKKTGLLDNVIAALGQRKVIEFGGIEPNPSYETLIKAVELVKSEGIDFLLGVGGGSVMDGTKFVAMAAQYEGKNTEDLLRSGVANTIVKSAIPLGLIATLPATGSEMNSFGVITHNAAKHAFSSPHVFPTFSLLDPSLTFTLPPIQVANGVVDAFVHTVEQYVTQPVDARFQDRAAEGILKTLIEIGKKTVDNPTDYDARANLVWCATNALNGLVGAGVPQDWATHMIGHELTAMFGIDHAQTLAIVLPSLWRIRTAKKHEKLLQYARRVWEIDEADEDKAISMAILKTEDFFESLGIKTKLSAYGVEKSQIEDIVGALKQSGRESLSETRDLDLDISRTILNHAY